jgi:hypothetical protein
MKAMHLHSQSAVSAVVTIQRGRRCVSKRSVRVRNLGCESICESTCGFALRARTKDFRLSLSVACRGWLAVRADPSERFNAASKQA